MPIPYLRRLTGHERDKVGNRRLACFLAFIAGATNAGGFLAVGQYTSHMSGLVSSMADNLALGRVSLMLAGLGALLAFIVGAACTAIVVNWARRRNLKSLYAVPLMMEALLLLGFGIMGDHLMRHVWLYASGTVFLLCFTMGLQNAIITKISQAEIRTTHVTGMVTDIGIELGKLVYWNGDRKKKEGVYADFDKLTIFSALVALFFIGGCSGAVAFKRVGFISVLPLTLLLMLMAVVPIVDDVRDGLQRSGKSVL